MKNLLDSFVVRWLGKLSMLIVLTLFSPFLLLMMMFDIKHLTQVAESIEPRRPGDEPPPATTLGGAIINRVVRPALLVVALPVICLVGGFMWVIQGDDDDDMSLR